MATQTESTPLPPVAQPTNAGNTTSNRALASQWACPMKPVLLTTHWHHFPSLLEEGVPDRFKTCSARRRQEVEKQNAHPKHNIRNLHRRVARSDYTTSLFSSPGLFFLPLLSPETTIAPTYLCSPSENHWFSAVQSATTELPISPLTLVRQTTCGPFGIERNKLIAYPRGSVRPLMEEKKTRNNDFK